MADIDPPVAAAPAPARTPSAKSWADVADTALHYAAGAGLLLLASRLALGAEILGALVLGAAATIGIKVTNGGK